ncbi:MAG: Butyrate kinase [Firmicutes bacterium]|nr:Butyrate kinase [Bacillota bacterium]
MKRILVINPGATSTKIAIFDEETAIFEKTLEHQGTELNQFAKIIDQYPYRLDLILDELAKASIPLTSINAIVARGGLLKPLPGGTYAVNERMVEDLKKAERGEHASNIGAVIAYALSGQLRIPAFIVDPVSVDELEPVARISGLPDLPRVSLSHALNSKAVARNAAKEMGKRYEDVNLITAHLGTGVTVAAHKNGKMIDVNNAQDDGPFSPDRCGGLPASQLVKLCFSGKYDFSQLRRRMSGEGGMYAYLGTKDVRDAEKRAKEGDEAADLVLDALAYQVAKEIGSMAAVLEGQVDRIIITGGIAYSKRITEAIAARVKFIAPVVLAPGEAELRSLAAGALRVLQGEELSRTYSG